MLVLALWVQHVPLVLHTLPWIPPNVIPACIRSACRWILHKQLPRSLQLLQQAPAADSAAAAVSPAGHAAVLPVQLRQFMPTGALNIPCAAAAVDSAGQLIQQEGAPASGSSRHSGRRSGDSLGNTAGQQAKGVVAVSRFASHGAAAGDLQLPLLQFVRELLYGQASCNSN
jgi:hypothetical protein